MPARIRTACAIGIEEGVDFLKTSTGEVPVNATVEAAEAIIEAIAAGSGHCGFKAAGGVRNLDDAATYPDLAEARLGADWIDPTHFHIGASALFGELVNKASSRP